MPAARTTIDQAVAEDALNRAFAAAEGALLAQIAPEIDASVGDDIGVLFKSGTQAYREVLLGSVLVRLQSRSINLAQPYVNQGPRAYNGRTLDERVINPFLQAKRIPCSRGPFLSVFRRSVEFNPSTRDGVRDKASYDAFLRLLACLRRLPDDQTILRFLTYLLYQFVLLRDASAIRLSRLARVSLEQIDMLLERLLTTPSGGRFPVVIAIAAFQAVKERFQTNWEIEHQGINVADAAAGARGDIMIRDGQHVVLAAEITERPVDRSRVAATFNAKIVASDVQDYLFLVSGPTVEADARRQAAQYFAQGHEVNFVDLRPWVIHVLAALGVAGRGCFNAALLDLLDQPDVPTSLKVVWNSTVSEITTINRGG